MGTTILEGKNDYAASLGFKPFQLTRLKRIVAVAGANGAGKTRLLQYVRSSIQHRNNNQPNDLWFNEARKELATLALEPPPLHNTGIHSQRLDSLRRQVDTERWSRSVDSAPSTITHLIRPRPGLTDTASFARNQIHSFESQAEAVGNDDQPQQYALAHIEKIQTHWFNTSHPASQASPELAKRCLESFNYLQELVEKLLGERLDFESTTRHPMMFGKAIGLGHLSDGQQLLLELAVDIHAKKPRLADAIIFFDEPELHLHPSAVIEVVDQIASMGERTQLWIATHCVPLLAHLNSRADSTIIYMKNGEPAFAGTTPQNVLRSLLGNDSRIAELQDYIGLPDELAVARFSAECLLPPVSMDAHAGDPQVEQIRKLVLSGNDRCSIIDYGAGKGRLVSALLADHAGNIADQLRYFAIERDSASASICKQACSALNDSARVFASESELKNDVIPGSVDVVVLCNVLHEIAPSDWISIFTDPHGAVQRSLKPDGKILIVEDLALPHGEHAHNDGFLIFDTAQLHILFSVTEDDRSTSRFIVSSERNGRLKAHLIHKSVAARLTAETRKQAIQDLKQSAKENIERIRDSQIRDYQTGRSHGFWLAQFANASLWVGKNGGQ